MHTAPFVKLLLPGDAPKATDPVGGRWLPLATSVTVAVTVHVGPPWPATG